MECTASIDLAGVEKRNYLAGIFDAAAFDRRLLIGSASKAHVALVCRNAHERLVKAELFELLECLTSVEAHGEGAQPPADDERLNLLFRCERDGILNIAREGLNMSVGHMCDEFLSRSPGVKKHR